MYGEFLDILNNWTPEIQLTVKVKFVQHGTNAPVTGDEYIVRIYDKDLFTDDDYLGHAQLDANGEAHIHFFPTDIANHDLGFEKLPDLYILLFKDNLVHFQTKVWDNVNFAQVAKLDRREGEVVDFGTFLVE